MECLFCKIIKGEIPSYKVYEDYKVLVFLDIHPDSMGHSLIIPKQHFQDLEDIDMETLCHILKIAQMMKKKLEETLHCTGISLIQNNGTAQEIKHFHLHIKPHYSNKIEVKTIEEVYALLH